MQRYLQIEQYAPAYTLAGISKRGRKPEDFPTETNDPAHNDRSQE